jgi:hypothetical protein
MYKRFSIHGQVHIVGHKLINHDSIFRMEAGMWRGIMEGQEGRRGWGTESYRTCQSKARDGKHKRELQDYMVS